MSFSRIMELPSTLFIQNKLFIVKGEGFIALLQVVSEEKDLHDVKRKQDFRT